MTATGGNDGSRATDKLFIVAAGLDPFHAAMPVLEAGKSLEERERG